MAMLQMKCGARAGLMVNAVKGQPGVAAALATCIVLMLVFLSSDGHHSSAIQHQCMTRECEAVRYFAYEKLVKPREPVVQAGDWPVILSEGISDAPCTVFSVGMADQPDFENRWAERGCSVMSFDPFVNMCRCHENVHLHAVGLSALDDSVERAVRYSHYGRFNVRLATLQLARTEVGHSTDPIHVLRFDCDGCEIGVLHDVATRTPELIKDVEQVLFKLHLPTESGMQASNRVQQVAVIQQFLGRQGFVPFHRRVVSDGTRACTMHPALQYAGVRRGTCCLELGFSRVPVPPPVVEPSARTVYATMVTGRDESRMALASVSIESFFRQTFGRRHLIIVNDGAQSIDRFLMAAVGRVAPAFELRDLCEGATVDSISRDAYTLRTLSCIEVGFAKQQGQTVRVTEVAVDAKRYAAVHGERPRLGQLRNLALAEIPDGEVFVQWDDDDWHEPEYIAQQYRALETSGADAVLLQRQLMYAFQYDSAVIKEDRSGGIFGTIMGRVTRDLAYPNLGRSEDKYFIDLFERIHMWDNNPGVYVRMVHMGNTWPAAHFKTRFAGSRVPGADEVLSRVVPKYEPFVRNQHRWNWPTSTTPFLWNVAGSTMAVLAACLVFVLAGGRTGLRDTLCR